MVHTDGSYRVIEGILLLVALLELARRWAADPPRGPVWLVAFDQEEWGLVGSAALAAQLKQAGQPLKLMVSLEMLASTSPSQDDPHPAMRVVYGDRGEFIALVANDSAEPLLPGLARTMRRHVPTSVLPVPSSGRDIPDVRLSDHSPCWDQGYNALIARDSSLMRNPHGHERSNTAETLDLPFFCGVVEGLAEALGRA